MPSIFLPVAEAYDRWSSFYDAYDNPMVFMASEIVRRSLVPNVVGQDVFEFGCGTGRNLAMLEAAGAKSLTGCDLSDGMLAVARGKSPKLRLFQHDMATQPVSDVPPRSMDLVLFSLTLEHVEDLAGPLIQARRMLRPTGSVAIIEIHPFLSLTGLAAHFDEGEDEVRMPAFPHQFQDYMNVFPMAGLRVEVCREWRPVDAGNPPPLQGLKRGPEFPLTLQFLLVPAL